MKLGKFHWHLRRWFVKRMTFCFQDLITFPSEVVISYDTSSSDSKQPGQGFPLSS